MRASCDFIGRGAQLRDDGPLCHVDRAGVEHPRRLRRAVLVRTCALLRHRRLHPGDCPTAGRDQRLGCIADGCRGQCAGRALRGCADIPLRAQGFVFRARHLGLCRSLPHRGLVGAFHRRWGRADGAAARIGGQPAVCISQWVSLGRSGIRHGRLAGDLVAAQRPLRRLPAGRARQRGCGACGRCRPVPHQARGHRHFGRLHGRGGCVLRPGVPVHRSGHRLRFGHLGRGAGRGHRRRHGHAVGTGARRCSAACAVGLHAQSFRRTAGHQHGDLWDGAGADRDLSAARHRRHRLVGAATVGREGEPASRAPSAV
jgi:hypothetical protein